MQSCFQHAAPKSLCILLPTPLLRVSFIAASQPSGVGTMSFTWRAENCLHFYPLAHQARCHSQWLMDVKVLKSNSCSSGCYLTPQHPHRIGLRLGVQLKSLLLDFFFFPLLLPHVPYWLVLGVLHLITWTQTLESESICRKRTLAQVIGQLERLELIRGPLASTDTLRLQASCTQGELFYL